ncbi:MAG: DoxX family protein [Pseudomonadales bacterium]|nr:DoxX family protein [Pseudomonadales bacterium]
MTHLQDPLTTPVRLIHRANQLLSTVFQLDFLAPFLLRLYLAPVFYMAGEQKLTGFENTVEWFGNEQWGLGLPFPWLLAALAAVTEYVGAILLLFGFATRWICIPLIITMAVAIVTVHLENGWLAIASGTGIFATERTAGAAERLERARAILQEYGNYDWLTANGSFVVLNNGIEFGATYLIMLIALFFMGAGKYISLDYWCARRFGQAS